MSGDRNRNTATWLIKNPSNHIQSNSLASNHQTDSLQIYDPVFIQSLISSFQLKDHYGNRLNQAILIKTFQNNFSFLTQDRQTQDATTLGHGGTQDRHTSNLFNTF